ncbi:type IV pilus modification PilV family protein [Coralloluteibacterium thermophilus]|uniref:Prepilin-type N-terminal cleavage/methylation domain-containing protein n=1 Tax=Coralloluteibacterium thermophilum TaxID=2707049 RepID=A0ABV9NLS2_9GAMM
MSRPAPRRRAAGYTLLEVMVAFALLAVGLGILLGILAGGVRQVRDAQATSEAALYAESLLDGERALGALEPGVRRGEWAEGRYRWTLSVEDYVDPLAGDAGPVVSASPARLRHLVLEVHWGEGGPRERLRLSTLHAGIDPGALAPPAMLDPDGGR